MKKEDLSYLKELLEGQLDHLLNLADHTVSDLLEKDSNAPDLLDRAALESARDYTLRIRNRESQTCGEDIGVKRLKARPVARHCIVCKSKMEETERAAGF